MLRIDEESLARSCVGRSTKVRTKSGAATWSRHGAFEVSQQSPRTEPDALAAMDLESAGHAAGLRGDRVSAWRVRSPDRDRLAACSSKSGRGTQRRFTAPTAFFVIVALAGLVALVENCGRNLIVFAQGQLGLEI